jgi:hypothetical protein
MNYFFSVLEVLVVADVVGAVVEADEQPSMVTVNRPTTRRTSTFFILNYLFENRTYQRCSKTTFERNFWISIERLLLLFLLDFGLRLFLLDFGLRLFLLDFGLRLFLLGDHGLGLVLVRLHVFFFIGLGAVARLGRSSRRSSGAAETAEGNHKQENEKFLHDKTLF